MNGYVLRFCCLASHLPDTSLRCWWKEDVECESGHELMCEIHFVIRTPFVFKVMLI